MRMIPQCVNPRSSHAEQQIFAQLAELEVEGWDYALHSINLPEHERKRVCEIDFLLVGERGVLGLEVKGGAVTRTKGVWRTQTLKGTGHRLRESPLDQARLGVFSLEQRLRRHIGGDLVERTVFGYGVVFPDCDFDTASVEWEPDMLLDASRLDGEGWGSCLDRLGKFWEGKPGGRTALAEDDVQRYLDVLRPDFDRVLTLRQLGKAVDAEVVALTELQYRALDGSGRNPRLIFEGGAGTGKTMLAAEMCRRARQSHERILLTCRGGVLANFIKSQPDLDGVTVLPFNQVSEIDRGGVDLMVVDEAQDVINKDDLEVIDRVLSGGLADGRWVFLLDSNNQRDLVGRYEDEAFDRLRSHRPAEITLIDNCRNTIEIVRATQDRTGADLGVTTAGPGQEVTVIDGPRGVAAAAVAAVLDDLEEQQVPLDQVVLLAPRDLSRSVFSELSDHWRQRIDVLDLMRMRRPAPGRVGFATVADFKGLEKRYVVLEAQELSDSLSARAQLYVGMTRAKAALWIVCPSGLPGGEPA
jgi:hypothetical protein